MIQNCTIWKVFAEFVKYPSKFHQIRGLSRDIKLATTSVRIHLQELEKNNLIKKEKIGIYSSYKANFESEDFRFYKKILNIINLRESGLIAELEKKFTPNAIVLFGSYMKGEDTEKSDIDLLLIAKEKNIDLKFFEKKLSRTPHLFFSEDLNKLPKEMLNNILNGIILSGFVRWKI